MNNNNINDNNRWLHDLFLRMKDADNEEEAQTLAFTYQAESKDVSTTQVLAWAKAWHPDVFAQLPDEAEPEDTIQSVLAELGSHLFLGEHYQDEEDEEEDDEEEEDGEVEDESYHQSAEESPQPIRKRPTRKRPATLVEGLSDDTYRQAFCKDVRALKRAYQKLPPRTQATLESVFQEVQQEKPNIVAMWTQVRPMKTTLAKVDRDLFRRMEEAAMTLEDEEEE